MGRAARVVKGRVLPRRKIWEKGYGQGRKQGGEGEEVAAGAEGEETEGPAGAKKLKGM